MRTELHPKERKRVLLRGKDCHGPVSVVLFPLRESQGGWMVRWCGQLYEAWDLRVAVCGRGRVACICRCVAPPVPHSRGPRPYGKTIVTNATDEGNGPKATVSSEARCLKRIFLKLHSKQE